MTDLRKMSRRSARVEHDADPVVFRDYSRDIDMIRQLHTATLTSEAAAVIVRPLLALAQLFGRERLMKSLSAVDTLESWSNSSQWASVNVWKLRYRFDPQQDSPIVCSLAQSGEYIGTLKSMSSNYHYHNVYGIPVAVEPFAGSTAFYSPAPLREILSAATAIGSRWIIDQEGGLRLDTATVESVMSAETIDIIERTKRHSTCRSWVLWGPPRGGKSIAARQIAMAIGDGWVRVCGRAALDDNVWATIYAMRPSALILDDLDACAKDDDALLGWVEGARAFAKVIISTMNILPTQGHGEHDLRGALLAPGRAADERPRHYAKLDRAIVDQIAPSVPVEFRADDLLAGYLAELELRARSGAVGQADVEEMRERMRAVGDR